TIPELPAGDLFENVQRLVDEELLQPFQIPDEEGLVEAERGADLLANLGRDRQGKVPGRIVRRQVEKCEDDKADDQQRRNCEEQPPDRKSEHADVSRLSQGSEMPASLLARPAFAITSCGSSLRRSRVASPTS